MKFLLPLLSLCGTVAAQGGLGLGPMDFASSVGMMERPYGGVPLTPAARISAAYGNSAALEAQSPQYLIYQGFNIQQRLQSAVDSRSSAPSSTNDVNNPFQHSHPYVSSLPVGPPSGVFRRLDVGKKLLDDDEFDYDEFEEEFEILPPLAGVPPESLSNNHTTESLVRLSKFLTTPGKGKHLIFDRTPASVALKCLDKFAQCNLKHPAAHPVCGCTGSACGWFANQCGLEHAQCVDRASSAPISKPNATCVLPAKGVTVSRCVIAEPIAFGVVPRPGESSNSLADAEKRLAKNPEAACPEAFNLLRNSTWTRALSNDPELAFAVLNRTLSAPSNSNKEGTSWWHYRAGLWVNSTGHTNATIDALQLRPLLSLLNHNNQTQAKNATADSEITKPSLRGSTETVPSLLSAVTDLINQVIDSAINWANDASDGVAQMHAAEVAASTLFLPEENNVLAGLHSRIAHLYCPSLNSWVRMDVPVYCSLLHYDR